MSSSLHWRPAPKDVPPARDLDSDLLFKLRKRLWDGNPEPSAGDEMELSKEDLPYLDGLADGGVTDAEELATAIREHGRVLIWVEH